MNRQALSIKWNDKPSKWPHLLFGILTLVVATTYLLCALPENSTRTLEREHLKVAIDIFVWSVTTNDLNWKSLPQGSLSNVKHSSRLATIIKSSGYHPMVPEQIGSPDAPWSRLHVRYRKNSRTKFTVYSGEYGIDNSLVATVVKKRIGETELLRSFLYCPHLPDRVFAADTAHEKEGEERIICTLQLLRANPSMTPNMSDWPLYYKVHYGQSQGLETVFHVDPIARRDAILD